MLCWHMLKDTGNFNPLVTNGLSHPYHLDESIFTIRGIRSIYFFSFLFHFSMKFMKTDRLAPDGTTRFAASHRGLFYLPMYHKKDTRLLWVKLKFLEITHLRNDFQYVSFTYFDMLT